MDVNVGRLQDVVDKGLRLICLDAQAIYAITIGTEGIKHTKLDKLPIGQNRRRYRVSYTLLLKLSLSSPFLSAKDHIINRNLLYCDFVLLALMVSLLLFP